MCLSLAIIALKKRPLKNRNSGNTVSIKVFVLIRPFHDDVDDDDDDDAHTSDSDGGDDDGGNK